MNALRDVFVPEQAAGSRLLEARGCRTAALLERGEGFPHIAGALSEGSMQGDGVLHGHARSGAERKVHGAKCIAEQNDVLVWPAGIAHDVRFEPERAVRQQSVRAELGAEHLRTEPAALLFALAIQSRPPPGIGVDLYQERAEIGTVLIAMRYEDPETCFAKDQRYRVKALSCAVPCELVATPLKDGLEGVGVLSAHDTVAAICGDQQIDFTSQLFHIVDPPAIPDRTPSCSHA